MRSLFAKQDGNDVALPDGSRFRMDHKEGADKVFDLINAYGSRCVLIGTAFTAAGMVVGIVAATLWDEEIKPRIQKRKERIKAKRTGA